MSKVEVTVCDICNEVGKPTLPYSAEGAGMKVQVDLCQDDSAPLRAFLEAHGKRKPGRRPIPDGQPVAKKATASRGRAGRPRGSTPKMTLEEIEAAKKGR